LGTLRPGIEDGRARLVGEKASPEHPLDLSVSIRKVDELLVASRGLLLKRSWFRKATDDRTMSHESERRTCACGCAKRSPEFRVPFRLDIC
jgi:hypothetical protein